MANEEGTPLEIKPVALDAFVFLLNEEHPVDSLTLEQIRDIYSGRIVNELVPAAVENRRSLIRSSHPVFRFVSMSCASSEANSCLMCL